MKTTLHVKYAKGFILHWTELKKIIEKEQQEKGCANDVQIFRLWYLLHPFLVLTFTIAKCSLPTWTTPPSAASVVNMSCLISAPKKGILLLVSFAWHSASIKWEGSKVTLLTLLLKLAFVHPLACALLPHWVRFHPSLSLYSSALISKDHLVGNDLDTLASLGNCSYCNYPEGL